MSETHPQAELEPAADASAELRAPLTVLVCLVPLAVAGELLRWQGFGIGQQQLLADPILAHLGGLIGLTLPVLPLIALIVGALLAQVFGGWPWQPPSARTLALALAWSLAWVAARVALAGAWHRFGPDQLSGPAGLALCGAFQEELVFRALVLGGLVLLLRTLHVPAILAAVAGLVVSAPLFSLAHTVVINHFPGAEPFAWPVFIERTGAGVLYGIAFLRHGLAVATAAHAGFNALRVFAPQEWLDFAG